MSHIEIHGRSLELRVSPAAARRLRDLGQPLLVEMELYFSCLIRKRVLFHTDRQAADAVQVSPNLSISFRPVTTANCAIADAGDTVPTMVMPLVNPAAFVPHRLDIDYRHGRWRGDFTWLPRARERIGDARLAPA